MDGVQHNVASMNGSIVLTTERICGCGIKEAVKSMSGS